MSFPEPSDDRIVDIDTPVLRGGGEGEDPEREGLEPCPSCGGFHPKRAAWDPIGTVIGFIGAALILGAWPRGDLSSWETTAAGVLIMLVGMTSTFSIYVPTAYSHVPYIRLCQVFFGVSLFWGAVQLVI